MTALLACLTDLGMGGGGRIFRFPDDQDLEFGNREARRKIERNYLNREVLENLCHAERLVFAFREAVELPVMRGEILELFAKVHHVSEKAPRRIARETERTCFFRIPRADGAKEQPLFIRFGSLFEIQQDVPGRRNVRKKRKGRRAVRAVPVAPVEAEIFPLKAFLGVFLPVPVDEKTGAAGNREIVRNGSGFFKRKRKEEFLPFHGFIHPQVINEVFRAV